jgi:hypothetical protein
LKKILVLVGFLAAAAIAGAPSSATTYATRTFKTVTINITITPTPIAYVPTRAIGRDDRIALGSVLRGDDTRQAIAFEPIRLGDVTLAPNQSSVPVTWSVLSDPNFIYLHINPINTSLTAGYGANTWTCPFSVFAHYPTAWEVSDYIYGSNGSGGTAGLNGFPNYNYPTTSLLQWKAEGITTSFKAYSNDGPPGEVVFTGAAGSTQTVCIDLSLNVPTGIAPGTYQATIQYNLLTAL